MKRLLLLTLFSVACLGSVSAEHSVIIKTPDGEPASGARFVQSFFYSFLSDEEAMGMEYGGYDDMGMGMGMETGGFGSMMSMGGGEMMGGMASGAAPTSSHQPSSLDRSVVFLNGKPLTKLTRRRGSEITADPDGKVQIHSPALSQNESLHRFPAMVIHSSGFSFLPEGTSASSEIRLRRGGTLKVEIPDGVDESNYVVLAYWQNGFAPPNQPAQCFSGDSYSVGKNFDSDDWRFSPRFVWFQINRLGEYFRMPPGEVRITIVPNEISGRRIEEMDAAELEQAMLFGGPSRIVVVQSLPAIARQVILFPVLRTISCKLPTGNREPLPQWGDTQPREYRLYRISNELPEFIDADVRSNRGFAEYLNRNRKQRSEFPNQRLPSIADDNSVRFELLTPGKYWARKSNTPDEGGDELTQVMETVDWRKDGNLYRCQFLDSGASPQNGAFEMLASEKGETAFLSTHQSAQARKRSQQSQTGVDDGARDEIQRLQLIRTLQSEIEQTVKRLLEHHRRLKAMEHSLRDDTTPTNPFGPDPFGPAPSGSDPFGPAPSSSDPFGPAPSSPDPFGPAPSSPDPFGG